MPVCFAVLRRLAVEKAWGYFVGFVSIKRTGGGGSLIKRHCHELGNIPEEYLPKIPKATITGLRSFIRKAHRSRSKSPIELSTYAKLASVASIDEHYHSYLKDSRALAIPKPVL